MPLGTPPDMVVNRLISLAKRARANSQHLLQERRRCRGPFKVGAQTYAMKSEHLPRPEHSDQCHHRKKRWGAQPRKRAKSERCHGCRRISLFPRDLEVTPSEIKRVLFVGSCLSEAYLRHIR